MQAQIELGFERFLEEKNYQAIVTPLRRSGQFKTASGPGYPETYGKRLWIRRRGRLEDCRYGTPDEDHDPGQEGRQRYFFHGRLYLQSGSGKRRNSGSSYAGGMPTIADGPISIKCQPLSMGDREDPARLVFTSKTGKAVATSLIDLGDRFRLIINNVECKKVEKPMPKLPVATAFWTPEPNLQTGAEAWILAGGAHHTAFSYDLTAEQMGDWAAAMGIEAVYIDKDTDIRSLKNELRWNAAAFRLHI